MKRTACALRDSSCLHLQGFHADRLPVCTGVDPATQYTDNWAIPKPSGFRLSAAAILVTAISEAVTAMLLATEEVEIQYDGASHSYPCSISFDLKRSNPLSLEPLQSIDAICSDWTAHKPFLLAISGVKKAVECIAESVTVRIGEEPSGTLVKLLPSFFAN